MITVLALSLVLARSKEINDSFGHPFRHVAAILQRSFRSLRRTHYARTSPTQEDGPATCSDGVQNLRTFRLVFFFGNEALLEERLQLSQTLFKARRRSSLLRFRCDLRNGGRLR